MDEYLTPQQAAARKGVAVSTIYKAMQRGHLQRVEKYGRILLREADVEAYQPGSYRGVQRAVRPRGTRASQPSTTF